MIPPVVIQMRLARPGLVRSRVAASMLVRVVNFGLVAVVALWRACIRRMTSVVAPLRVLCWVLSVAVITAHHWLLAVAVVWVVGWLSARVLFGV